MIEKSGYIVLDFETTGMLHEDPEVLQVSIINDKDEILMSGYCRPEHTDNWEQAQAIHGITPERLKTVQRSEKDIYLSCWSLWKKRRLSWLIMQRLNVEFCVITALNLLWRS